jgi:hypothetical protein
MGSSANVTTSHADGMVGYHVQDQTMGNVSVEHVCASGDGQVKPVSAQKVKKIVIHLILLKSAWAEDHANVGSASVKKTTQGNIVMSVR